MLLLVLLILLLDFAAALCCCFVLLAATAAACYYCHHVAAYSCLANGAFAAAIIIYISLNFALNNDHAACTHPVPCIYEVYNN